jgi:uncharacterized membrane protein
MSVVNAILDVIKRQFVSGMLVVVPVILTFIVLRFLFQAIDGILDPLLSNLLGFYRAGLGVLTLILLILLFGFLTRNFVGRRIYELGDRLLARVPLIRPIYTAAKQLMEAMTSSSGGSFKDVGLVEYPRRGVYQLCFVSNRLLIEDSGDDKPYYSVFVPSSPTPVSGMVVVVPEDELIFLEMSVEDGIKFLVSGGVASPEQLRRRATS